MQSEEKYFNFWNSQLNAAKNQQIDPYHRKYSYNGCFCNLFILYILIHSFQLRVVINSESIISATIYTSEEYVVLKIKQYKSDLRCKELEFLKNYVEESHLPIKRISLGLLYGWEISFDCIELLNVFLGGVFMEQLLNLP